MLQNLGYNLNRSVSMFLNGFHNMVPVDYYKYLGENNNFGVITPNYAPPVTMNIQQQVPERSALKYIRKELDIKYVRQFWGDWEVLPAERVNGTGGDLIWYDNHIWYVEAIPDDFRQVGWMSVLGVMTFESRPT